MTVKVACCEECGEEKLTGYNGCLKKQVCSGCLVKLMPQLRLTEEQANDSLLDMMLEQKKGEDDGRKED